MSLADHTTLRVGGPAEHTVVASTRDEIIEAATRAWNDDEPLLVLGGGSNVLISDDGFAGTVLLIRTEGVRRIAPSAESPEPQSEDSTQRVTVRIEAGHDWDAFVAWSVAEGLSGVEALSGIPGRAGAAPMQNIGAYGAELADVLVSIELLDHRTHDVRHIAAADLGLRYRSSALKRGEVQGTVLSIEVELSQSEQAAVRYPQLANALGVPLHTEVPLAQIRQSVLALRASKGMVVNESDHDSWSAGSFFTNPVVTERAARSLPREAPQFLIDDDDPPPAVTPLADLAAGLPLNLPSPAPERMVKLSAAWLIEHAGVPKGFAIPGSRAAVSTKHTLALTNRGGATAGEIAELARLVHHRVQQEFGVMLEPEPRFIGLEL